MANFEFGNGNFQDQVKIVTSFHCSGQAHNFNKYDRGEVDTLKVPYDYDSIMHYGTNDFSKNGKPTLRSIKDPKRALGQSNGFTQIDIQEINSLYQCSSKSFDDLSTLMGRACSKGKRRASVHLNKRYWWLRNSKQSLV